MKSHFSGECNCGNITYTLSESPLFNYVCHCGNCKKRTGSAFSMGCVVSIDKLDVQGELACWERVSDNGSKNAVYRCAECGNVIYGVGEYTPGLAKLMPGTLSNPHEIEPDVHIWTSRAQKWVTVPEEVLQYAEQPEDFSEALELAAKNRAQRAK